MTAPAFRRRFWVVASLLAAVSLLAASCSSSGSTAPSAASSSSSNSSILPTPSGTVPDSIEDVNSNKDMTGVVTQLSGDKNPYNTLIPYVCPFLPDSLTQGKLGMSSKRTSFGGKHTLIQACDMATDTGPNYEQLSIGVIIRSVSIADLLRVPGISVLRSGVRIAANVTGILYKLSTDDKGSAKFCNLAWGTFYGSAAVTVSVDNGYAADPCAKAVEVAPEISPFLPKEPLQMRPTEG